MGFLALAIFRERATEDTSSRKARLHNHAIFATIFLMRFFPSDGCERVDEF